MKHELSDGDAGLLKQKQVLRTAEGGQQRTTDRRYILHRNDRQNIGFLFCRTEEKDRQRYKNDQRYIVRHEHGGKEYAEDQKEGDPGHGGDLFRKLQNRLKNIFLFKPFQHRQHHKKDRQRVPVDASECFNAGF